MAKTGLTGGLLNREDAMLVVIDVQDRLFPHVAEGPAALANIVKLIRYARIMDLPVLLAEQQKLGPTVAEIKEQLPTVAPVPKNSFGCLGCEDFRVALQATSKRALILVGIEAHVCVAQTALQALEDYTVHVVADAVTSRSLTDKQVALQRLQAAGVVITSTEMLMYELLRRAASDEFRAVLELVKGS